VLIKTTAFTDDRSFFYGRELPVSERYTQPPTSKQKMEATVSSK
jgi:hypothetical protein